MEGTRFPPHRGYAACNNSRRREETALTLRPDEPVYCFRPEVLKADCRQFMGMFPGKTAYAVKTNGERMVLKAWRRPA